MTTRPWRTVTKAKPCPACGKPDWCAWTHEGWLKCERSTDAPAGFRRVSVKDGGGVFCPDDPNHPANRNDWRRGNGDTTPRNATRGGGSVTVASVTESKSTGRTYATAREAIAELEHRHGRRAALWTYHNATGEPVGVVIRWKTPTGKDVRPVSRLPDGSGWTVSGIPTPRPLYGLPDLLATPAGSRVYVTEGEKAADAARAIGLVATTSPHGCQSASKANWAPLAGRHVVILPDHDEPGERYAASVMRLVQESGAKSVRIVRLVELWAGMPEGGDMADLLNHRGGEVDSIRVDVETLADNTEPEAASPAPAALDFKPFPVDVLPEPVRGFVRTASKAIGCDPAYVALAILPGLASAIGTTHRIALKRGWTEPAIVWTAIVAESGTKKSPPIELALAPIRKRQSDAMAEHAEAERNYTNALAVYERDTAQWKRSKDNTPPPTKPEAPIPERFWTDDATTEALAMLLKHNPRGLLMIRDELAGWFNFDRYASGKGGDAAKWLEMFGGRPMVVDRKTGGTLYVPHAAVSLTGSIQPDTLRNAMSEQHRQSGLAARLLFAMPPRRIRLWTEAEVDAAAEAALSAVFDRLYTLTPDTDDAGESRPRVLQLSHAGKRAWVTFYNEHAGEQMNLSGDEAAAWSKLEGYAARLALVVHLTRWAANDPTLHDPAQVDEASIAAGVVLARWFGDEARRVYALFGESEGDRETRRLVEWIANRGGSVTVRDLTRGPRKYRDTATATQALGALVAAGKGRWEGDGPGPAGGRPTDRFVLLAQSGDTGDGDETPKNTVNPTGSVTTTDSDNAGDGWGEV